jgi:hypothetical protein
VRFCSARGTKAAYLTKDDTDLDSCSIISDALCFLRIGFCVRKELLVKRAFASSEVSSEIVYGWLAKEGRTAK